MINYYINNYSPGDLQAIAISICTELGSGMLGWHVMGRDLIIYFRITVIVLYLYFMKLFSYRGEGCYRIYLLESWVK